eukprot:m.33022 g.33022  ORF g.33022 m.33022 type:complete len:771 (-) comp10249_c0_seq1:138-2450(-)
MAAHCWLLAAVAIPSAPLFRAAASRANLLQAAVCHSVSWPSLGQQQCRRRQLATSASTTAGGVNPLLADFCLPPFGQLQPDHVEPAVKTLLAESEAKLSEIEANLEAKNFDPAWEDLVVAQEQMSDKLDVAWGAVRHLTMVKDSPDLRKVHEQVLPDIVRFSTRVAQSEPLFKSCQTLKQGPKWSVLTEAQQRIVDQQLLSFELGGSNLDGSAREEFNEIKTKLSALSTKFSNNLLDSTKEWRFVATSQDEINGLPIDVLAQAAELASTNGHESATAADGPWAIGLDGPTVQAVLKHATDRSLRERVYTAYLTRASEGDHDNQPVIRDILRLRKRKAELLGFSSSAEVSLASKMATLPQAYQLLESLRIASVRAAKQDLADVTEFAKSNGFDGEELRHWDVGYYAERLKETQFNISDEATRMYFALPQVLGGAFGLVTRLFGYDIRPEVDLAAPMWHDDVQFFSVFESNTDRRVAFLYLDPYSRPSEKRGGAWMDEVVGKSSNVIPPKHEDSGLFFSPDGVRLPIAHIVCNLTPPMDGQPCLMTFREVETVFHELGHALQHMLTHQTEGMCSGIRGVEWDAVELPSQFMENWCYEKPTVDTFARHFETGEPLPDNLFESIKAAKTFRSGSDTLRQVKFGLMDLYLHDTFDPEATSSPIGFAQRMTANASVMPDLEWDRFLCGFSHIFAGGYSAGYFSYKWAEVLSADAFAAFEEVGLDNEEYVSNVGRRFAATVLALGGGLHPAEVFQQFRGRDPSVEALLRHAGLHSAS